MQTDLPYRRIGNHALLAVRLTPKAKEDAILGVEQFGSDASSATFHLAPPLLTTAGAQATLQSAAQVLHSHSPAAARRGRELSAHARYQIAQRRGSHPPSLSASAAPRAARGCLSGDRAGQSALALYFCPFQCIRYDYTEAHARSWPWAVLHSKEV